MHEHDRFSAAQPVGARDHSERGGKPAAPANLEIADTRRQIAAEMRGKPRPRHVIRALNAHSLVEKTC
jgi:hypothetical protein